jgi:hypothetical protein
MSDYTPAPVDAERVAQILEVMRKGLAQEFGVTLQTDASGAYGPMGRTTVALRFYASAESGDLITVSLTVDSVSSHFANMDRDAANRRNK